MGRSVSYPTDATTVLFVREEDPDDVFFFEDALEDFKSLMTEYFKSLGETDVWVGREDHAVLENTLAYFGISEYCGVISLWVLPKERFINLSVNWTNQIADKFKKAVKSSFGEVYVKVGRFSDGTSVYEKDEL